MTTRKLHPGKLVIASHNQGKVREMRVLLEPYGMELISAVAKVSLWKDAERISIISFNGLAVDAAKKSGASLIVRGLRNATDLDYEMQMAGMNGEMSPQIKTVFIPANPASRHITATLVRSPASRAANRICTVPS